LFQRPKIQDFESYSQPPQAKDAIYWPIIHEIAVLGILLALLALKRNEMCVQMDAAGNIILVPARELFTRLYHEPAPVY